MLSVLVCSLLLPSLTFQRYQTALIPPEPLPLGGYTERGGKVFRGEDVWPLLSHIVILREKDVRVAIVSLPLLTVPESLYREVRKQLPLDVQLFLVATHTHSAPDSQMLNDRMTLNIPGIANFRPVWLEWYSDKIARAVRGALTNRVERAPLLISQTEFDLNRGRRPGAWPDRWATLIQAGGKANLFFHYAAHAVFHGPENLELSGDWPGAVSHHLNAAVLPGAIGDVSPLAPGSTPASRIDAFVSQVITGLRMPTYESGAPLGWQKTPIILERAVAHPDFAKSNRIPPALAQNIVGKFAPREATVSAFRIGKLAVVGIPGEPTSHLGRDIRDYGRRIGFKYVLVCSHVNGWMGYILDPEDYDRGGYEATLSFYGREQGTKVVQAAKDALSALAKPSKTDTTPTALAPAR